MSGLSLKTITWNILSCTHRSSRKRVPPVQTSLDTQYQERPVHVRTTGIYQIASTSDNDHPDPAIARALSNSDVLLNDRHASGDLQSDDAFYSAGDGENAKSTPYPARHRKMLLPEKGHAGANDLRVQQRTRILFNLLQHEGQLDSRPIGPIGRPLPPRCPPQPVLWLRAISRPP
jgi:hypothetical protein